LKRGGTMLAGEDVSGGVAVDRHQAKVATGQGKDVTETGCRSTAHTPRSTMTDLAIRTAALGRTYRLPPRGRHGATGPASPGTFVAPDAVNLEARRGELFGLLGSNGAGKTTLIKILTTLLAPTTGSAWVDGLDVARQAATLRPRINMVSGGETSGYGIL